MMRYATVAMLCLLLAGCGESQHMASRYAEKLNTFDVAEPAKAATVQGPQIAYSYGLAYRIGDAQLAAAQARHVALCTGLGPTRCQIAKTAITAAAGGDTASGETKLLVEARIARAFQQKLDAIVSDAGGTASERTTTAEDITKQVIDTGARVRAKQALADRLMRLITQANGRVGDLVAAEQAFATTQEELDAARSLQASLQQRVAMSEIDISYTARESSSLWAPVRRSFGALGEAFGGSIAALVTFVVVALPWVVVLALLIWGLRRFGWRWPFRRRPRSTPPS